MAYNDFRLACRTVLGSCLLAAAWLAPALAQTPVAITTHHFDNARTGWNQNETVLTPANVAAPGSFGLQHTVALDARVDAQPLVVPGVAVAGDPQAGQHDVVYAVTEGNTVYAIDPDNGTILLSRNLGTPLTSSPTCGARRGTGIEGTPVIDLTLQRMYLVAAIQTGTKIAMVLHALDLSTLTDAVPPVVVSGEATLTNGSMVDFKGSFERQHPALLEAGGIIYTAFGTVCDSLNSRGWVLGWKASTLAPLVTGPGGLPTGFITNRDAVEPAPTQPNLYRTGIWMGGAGLAADSDAVYLVTANSHPGTLSYNGVSDFPNSVLKLSQTDLSLLSFYAPPNEVSLDDTDKDFGSGGVMLIPHTNTKVPPMAVAAGKVGTMYLLNTNSLGGFTASGPDKSLDSHTIGQCRCAESYFAGPTPQIVTSGGKTLQIWQFSAASPTKLTLYAQSAVLNNGPPYGGGFFTAISSNGTSAPVIWAILRPSVSTDKTVRLAAFGATPDPSTQLLPQLFSAAAGQWLDFAANPTLSPVVANGRVYVGADSQLTIFGLLPAAARQ